MGIFDAFKSKNPIEDVLTTLHCINANEWTDAGKHATPKELINNPIAQNAYFGKSFKIN